MAASQALAQDALPQVNDSYFKQAQAELDKIAARQPNTGKAKNVILFVGDGMSVTTVTAARIFDGQQKGVDGESNKLSFEELLPISLCRRPTRTTRRSPIRHRPQPRWFPASSPSMARSA